MTKKTNRRYYLHRKYKAGGGKYCPFKRTIYIPWDAILENKYAIALRDEYG